MYSGPMSGDFCYQVNHRTLDYVKNEMTEIPGKIVRLSKKFGDMPVMDMSKACHLNDKRPEQLVAMKEEVQTSVYMKQCEIYIDTYIQAGSTLYHIISQWMFICLFVYTLDTCVQIKLQHNEFGRCLIVNGIERCVRLLQIPRRNHPMAIKRSNYKNRGPTYSDLGVAIRCARSNDDQTSITNTVHYLTTGGASLRFSGRKQEFLIPLILLLRALSWREGGNASSAGSGSGAVGSGGITDEEIYHRILQGDEENTFLKARAELLSQDAQRYTGLDTPKECISYIGSKFRMLSMKADSSPDIEIGHYIINRYILIHLNTYGDKLECLLLLLRKLYSFAAGDCGVDNADSLQNQEILMPGHLMCSFVKEKFEEMFMAIRIGVLKEMRQDFVKTNSSLQDSTEMSKYVERYGQLSGGGIGKKIQHFLSTGNIISTTGLDLMQVSGYTIVAERLNFLRYCAHFRSVHRGQFFMEVKTTVGFSMPCTYSRWRTMRIA
mmetsp:Transcript_3987/g.7658  ORF Transcript_3987/g.7658 Transcript_3987/m.7658 type:complete len:492 (-) Transcript_3987:2463-3938(-)